VLASFCVEYVAASTYDADALSVDLSPASPLIGAVVDSKYRIESLLGRGGMGAVYRAVHVGTDRTVALKVIAGSFAGDPEYVERFRREARACGRLRHPGIVDVTDFGVASHAGRPLPYLVMEFLDGRTLADALRDDPVPPLPWTIDILEQVCAAVEEAHRHGILHRDLKPENVWLEPDRRGGLNVKVLDFGLAKLEGDVGEVVEAADASDAGESTTAARPHAIDATFLSGTIATMASAGGSGSSTGIAGTPAYMSPEQSRGEIASPRSDVYSIGVMAYRMVTGRLPFEGTPEEVITAQLHQEPPPMMSIRIDVHADAAALVSKALSKDPALRPATAGVFGNMLAAQLEPAGAFFTRALMLMVGHLRMFAAVSALVSVPMFAASALAAAWQLLSLTGAVPSLEGRAAAAATVAIFAFAMMSQLLFGVMPLFVLHAMAAPLRPIDVAATLRGNVRRLRVFLAGVMPIVIGLIGVLITLGLILLLVGLFRPQLRALPAAVRVAIVLAAMGIPFWIGYWALRRSGLGLQGSGLLGSVLLVEDLPVALAVKRSEELLTQSGAMRNAVQKRYLGVMMVLSMGAGVAMGAGGAVGRSANTFLLIGPLLAVLAMVFLAVNAVVNALIYISARRSKGESLERIYSDVTRDIGSIPVDDERLGSSKKR